MTSDDAFMVAAGVRYCLGRHSYAPSLCCGWLKTKWLTLSEGDRSVILRDIGEHISGVKEGRWHNAHPGWEADLQAWVSFREWATLSEASRDRYRAALFDVGRP
ncbi:hypothetical protein [Methylobacterium persicinum]|uniref:Uncharacterized protein n=1 Tax=Methylobacterium persicinum TaxID=374426 RepID=A0ABU0HJW5_9HYPH|nr:hypothetical protein [Methylobacterium persicinum]MDQ0442607.1 hypothetical protein [Methylobacterium persicinum]GJE37813.1 hypothetical protein KHHGKMAE_1875 [Methylobacterium persicinum]